MNATIRTPGEGRTIAVVGDVCRFLATGEGTNGRYAVWEAVVPRGGGPPPHVHSREEEGFYVLEGEIAFTVNGEKIEGGDREAPGVRPEVRDRDPATAPLTCPGGVGAGRSPAGGAGHAAGTAPAYRGWTRSQRLLYRSRNTATVPYASSRGSSTNRTPRSRRSA